MTCQDFWNTMPELAGAPLSEAAEAHARECAACSAVLQGHGALRDGLRRVAGEWSGMKAPGRVESRLVAAFRGQTGLAVVHPSRSWWAPYAGWSAAAAVLAAALMLIVVRARQPELPQYPAAETAGIDWTAGLPVDEISENADGEFIPLPNAEGLPANDHMNLVRVELPRSAMIALGYSVSADRVHERVQADVVLGSDGLARAVRFLDE